MRWLAVVALIAATPAWADDTDSNGNEKPTTIHATLAGTTVRLQAAYTFVVEGPGVALDTQSFVIPDGGLVTGGSVLVAGERHRLRLDKADAASKAFEALTLKPADHGTRAWAFVLAGGSGQVTLDVLAPRSARAVLELSVEAPTCFYRDARYVALPASWVHRLAAGSHFVTSDDDRDIAAACTSMTSMSEEPTSWLGFRTRHLVKQPAGGARIGTIAGRLPLAGAQLARVELDLARELGDLPRDLHTVIVIDHSRSMTTDELEAQRAIVAGYLRGAPLSQVQVIAYARAAEPLLASWTVASPAAARVDRAIRALPPRNGSNLDAALVAAGQWLARVDGTKRIVLFSDERLAERLGSVEPATLVDLVPRGTLIHVVRPTPGLLDRDDDGALAPLAAATQGIEMIGGADDDGKVDATMLLRPISLDHIEIGARGWETLTSSIADVGCATTLREGESCAWWGKTPAAGDAITVTGVVWNRPFKRVLRADRSQAQALARMLSVARALDEELQQQVDHIAHAVNDAWSLFAQWGGSGGYEDVGGGGSFGFGRSGSTSHDGGVTDRFGTAELVRLDLRAQLQPAVEHCHAGTARVDVEVETTREEIVEVGVQVAPTNPTLHDCITEAVWDTTLRLADAPGHATTRVAFGNKR